jgi:hypothetical protein
VKIITVHPILSAVHMRRAEQLRREALYRIGCAGRRPEAAALALNREQTRKENRTNA